MTFREHVRGFLFRGPMMITCKELDGFISDYVDGELPRWQRLLFDVHIRMCRECRDYLARYRRAMTLGRSVLADADQIPEEVPEELVQAVLGALGRRDGSTPPSS